MPEIRNGPKPSDVDTVTAIHVKHVPRIRLPRNLGSGRRRPWLSKAKLVVTAETQHGYFVPICEIRDLDRSPKETKIRIARTVFSELIGLVIAIELGIENTPDGPYQRFVGRLPRDHILADMSWREMCARELELTKIGGTD